MADVDPYVYALGTGIGGGIAFVGKYVFSFITSTLSYERTRADRLEEKLFSTQALVYPVLGEANSAIREAIAAKKET